LWVVYSEFFFEFNNRNKKGLLMDEASPRLHSNILVAPSATRN